MEASNSLKNMATNEAAKGSSSFFFGNTLYVINDSLPEESVANFFTLVVGEKEYIIYSRKEETAGV